MKGQAASREQPFRPPTASTHTRDTSARLTGGEEDSFPISPDVAVDDDETTGECMHVVALPMMNVNNHSCPGLVRKLEAGRTDGRPTEVGACHKNHAREGRGAVALNARPSENIDFHPRHVTNAKRVLLYSSKRSPPTLAPNAFCPPCHRHVCIR